MIVLDTNVVSEALRPRPAERVERWMRAQAPSSLFTTTICEAEIRLGVALLPAGRRRQDLANTVAVIFAVLDATRTLAAARLVMTPLGRSWSEASPQTMQAAETFVRQSVSPDLWSMVAGTVLAAPGFAVFGVLALLLFLVGHRRRRAERLVWQD